MTREHWTPKLCVALLAGFALLASACGMKVVNLTPAGPPPAELAQLPFEDVVAVEPLQTVETDDSDDARRFQLGFEKGLREANLFRQVTAPQAASFQVDFTLRGRVSGEFHRNGFLNFVTWFPGPFLLMHSWRGTRHFYDARADVELIDSRTQAVVGNYHAETRQRLTHQSGNPFHILGVVIIFPGAMKGYRSIKPALIHRAALYEEAYEDLWNKLAIEIARDRAPYYAARASELRQRCGRRLNAPPVSGTAWSEFIACQTTHFRPKSEEQTQDGRSTLYESEDGSIRVFVMDEWIVRWETAPSPGDEVE